MRFFVTSDWETNRDRLDITRKILDPLWKEMNSEDVLIFDGDAFRGFDEETISFVRSVFSRQGYYLVGNHDRGLRLDKLTAILATATHNPVISEPKVIPIGNHQFLGFLPAPNRAAFGASRGIEGKRARDEALSRALEAALVALETQIGPENLGRAILFFHGAVDGAEVGCGQLASGLTWTIPGIRLARWGLAVGGHIHRPGKISENVYSVGGIANWTFSDRAEQFRVLVIDTEPTFAEDETIVNGFGVSEIPLLRVLVQIEMDYDSDGLHGSNWGLYPPGADGLLPKEVLQALIGPGEIDATKDTVSLKIKARLPQHEMALVPSSDELMEDINSLVERKLIQSCIITREVTGNHKARIGTGYSRKLTLEEMLELYVTTTNAEAGSEIVSTEVHDRAKLFLAKIADSYKAPATLLGWKPLSLEVENWRQWQYARIDYQNLHGAVAVTGPNRAGKSNLIIEAPLFALCKSEASGDATLDRIIRKGANTASNTFCFELGGETYRIRRALERSKSRASCLSELHIMRGELWDAISNDDKEISKWVAEHIGSKEFIRWLIFRSQRDLNRIIEATGSEWHRILLMSFGLGGYEPLRKLADENAKNAALRANEAAILIDELTKQRDDEMLAFQSIDLDDLTCRIAGLAKQLADAEAAKGILDNERQGLIDHRAKLRAAANERANLEDRLRAAKRALATVTVEDIGTRPEVPKVDIAVLETAAVDLKARREKLLDADTAKRKELATASGEIEAHQGAMKRIEAEIETLEAKIKAHEAAKGELEEPPCEETPSPIDGTSPMYIGCPAWLYYSKADQGEELAEKLSAANERKTAELREAAIFEDGASECKKALAPIAADIAAINPTIRGLENKIGDYRNALHAAALWDEKAKGQEAERKRMEERAAEIDALEKQVAATADSGADLSKCLQDIERTENRIGAQDGIIKAARQVQREAEDTLAKREHIAEGIVKLNASIEKHAGDNAKHAADQVAWGLLALAYHATGAPYLLLERNVGRVQEVANELLADAGSDLSIWIRTVTPTQKAEARDTVSVGFTDERGEFQLSECSGEQSAELSMALSGALSIAGAEYSGSVAELYEQDEGWDKVDLAHQPVVRALISEIAKRFNRFIYISHVEWPIEAADMQLSVLTDNGTSRLVG